MDATHHYNKKGFSLLELLVVISLIALLTAIAIPSYHSYITQTNRLDGKKAVLELSARLEQYFFDFQTYTIDIEQLGGTITSERGFYTLNITAEDCGDIVFCYQISAEPIASSPQANDPPFTLNSLNKRTGIW